MTTSISQVTGFSQPRPCVSFAHFGFDGQLLALIQKSDFTKPTPIQSQSIPAALSGRDVIGIAKTGSGKTAAFLWPMLVHAMDQPQLKEGEGPIGLICAPTRELCVQVGWVELCQHLSESRYVPCLLIGNLNPTCGTAWILPKIGSYSTEILLHTEIVLVSLQNLLKPWQYYCPQVLICHLTTSRFTTRPGSLPRRTACKCSACTVGAAAGSSPTQ